MVSQSAQVGLIIGGAITAVCISAYIYLYFVSLQWPVDRPLVGGLILTRRRKRPVDSEAAPDVVISPAPAEVPSAPEAAPEPVAPPTPAGILLAPEEIPAAPAQSPPAPEEVPVALEDVLSISGNGPPARNGAV